MRTLNQDCPWSHLRSGDDVGLIFNGSGSQKRFPMSSSSVSREGRRKRQQFRTFGKKMTNGDIGNLIMLSKSDGRPLVPHTISQLKKAKRLGHG